MTLLERINPQFDLLETRSEQSDQPIIELDWLEEVEKGCSRAVLWQSQQCLVVPMSYRRFKNFDSICAQFAQQGWPVRMRRSGGGLVPQGPGVLNLTLAYPVIAGPGVLVEQVYSHLCSVLVRALEQLQINATAQEVVGSFCDGRFNLAVQGADGVQKIAGTAQYWRHFAGRHAVLAHALLLVDADTKALTQQCNEFEMALGSGRHYLLDSVTNVAQAWAAAHPDKCLPADLAAEVTQQISAALIS